MREPNPWGSRVGLRAGIPLPSNSRQVILGHHKLLAHLATLPLVLPGLDLTGIQGARVQVLLLLLLRGAVGREGEGEMVGEQEREK